MKALGGALIVECQAEIIPLLEPLGAADDFVPRGDAVPAADLHCYLCTLPGLFSPDAPTIPSAPYLTAPHERLGKFAAPLAAAGERFKVGIVWSGSVTFKKNHERAQPLMRFLQAFALPGVQLYSLQKGRAKASCMRCPRARRSSISRR